MNKINRSDVKAGYQNADKSTGAVVALDPAQTHKVEVSRSGTKSVLSIAPQPSTTARLIAAANSSRKGLVLYNNGSQTVYLGKDNTVTASNYMEALPAGARLSDDSTVDAWWGITASGTAAMIGYEVI